MRKSMIWGIWLALFLGAPRLYGGDGVLPLHLTGGSSLVIEDKLGRSQQARMELKQYRQIADRNWITKTCGGGTERVWALKGVLNLKHKSYLLQALCEHQRGYRVQILDTHVSPPVPQSFVVK